MKKSKGRQRCLWSLLILVSILYSKNLSAMVPLRISTDNPRYFTDNVGKPIYLTGSHTWTNFQDAGSKDPPPKFDFPGYLEFLEKHNHNFFRLWNWEQAKWVVHTRENFWFEPLPYSRSGPGTALDGKPKFDLTKFSETYFQRLRQRVEQAAAKNIYVAVMLFNGFSIECKETEGDKSYLDRIKRTLQSLWNDSGGCQKNRNPWRGHPLNRHNNVNGIDGDLDRDGEGKEIHTLKIPAVTRLQEQYVRKMIDTLNDLPNVLWEISNESPSDSIKWQYHFIHFIKKYESVKYRQHPVGMTVTWPGGKNADLWNSPADWISPNDHNSDSYKENPPVAEGKKVILSDTDHLWGIGGNHKWVWKSFLRGLNPIFMDPYNGKEFEYHPTKPEWDLIRSNMGYTLVYARKIDLKHMKPHPELASSRYCLAEAGRCYLIFTEAGEVTVDLTRDKGIFALEWLDPHSGKTTPAQPVTGGGSRSFKVPFPNEAVLYLHRDK